MESARTSSATLPGRESPPGNHAPAYLRRLPVVGPGQRLAGHLLLPCPMGTAGEDVSASWTELNTDDLFGSHWGMVPVPPMLLDDTLEGRFPVRQTIFRLGDDILDNETMLRRCHQLRRLGFRFAAAASLLRRGPATLAELVEIITVDLALTSPEEAARLAWRFSLQPGALLAERVATLELHEHCRRFNYRYCQGAFITLPDPQQRGMLAGSKLDHLLLFRKVLQGADLPELEDAFRRTPELTYRLLRLVNSVGIGCSYRIESIRHALTLLGQEQLLRWVLLSAFTPPADWSRESPLFSLVATRGKLLELLVQQRHLDTASPADGGSAFVTGILSLLHLSLDITPEEMCQHLSLDSRIEAALLTREGYLGRLLVLAEMLDGVRDDAIAKTLPELALDREALLPAQLAAFSWVNSIEQGL